MGVVVHCQLGEPQAHYYACPDCGWCSKVKHGEDSRLRAVLAGQRHQASKARAKAVLADARRLNAEEAAARDKRIDELGGAPVFS